MQIDKNLILNIIIVGLAFVLMKFMPRLLAYGIPFVNAKDVHDKLAGGDDIVVIDVRTANEYGSNTGHVAGAVNVPVGDLRGRLESAGGALGELKDHPVYLMCRTENRSSSAAKMMRRAGFKNVSVIKGGMTGWNKAGLPAEGKA